MIDLLDTKAVARTLGIARQTLARWRVEGISPPFVKCGSKVMTRRDDLEAWLASRTRHSTSDGA
jgi:predicted site-specific integrase-resolvase